MQLTPLPIWNDADMSDFENQCFDSWLSRISARLGYDERKQLSKAEEWRILFHSGFSVTEAIDTLILR